MIIQVYPLETGTAKVKLSTYKFYTFLPRAT